MAVKGTAQVDITDITDAYSVILTSEAHTFPGTTSAAKAGSTTTQIIAMLGGDTVAASVDLTAVVAPTGVTVTKDSDATSPTLTIAVSTAVTSAGTVDIPVTIGTDITIHKMFSFAIAFTGATGATGSTGATGKGISSTAITYQAGTSGTTAPTGTWSTSVPSVAASQYLWTRTVITYSDSTTSTSYSVGMMGATGATGGTGATGKGVSSAAITYQASTSGTTVPTGTWATTIPTVAAGSYLWTRTITTYTDSSTSTQYSVGMMGATGAKGNTGATGADGADALVVSITSSNGFNFKNTQAVTVLTAHVFKGGVELTSSTSPTLASQGTLKWYKDGSTTAAGTGQTLSITAGTVTSHASYVCQLEG